MATFISLWNLFNLNCLATTLFPAFPPECFRRQSLPRRCSGFLSNCSLSKTKANLFKARLASDPLRIPLQAQGSMQIFYEASQAVPVG